MKISHGKCGNSWSGMKREHCPACCETFNSATAGNAHRVGDWTEKNPRRCLTPEEMIAKGMVLREGVWLGSADSHPRREDFSA